MKKLSLKVDLEAPDKAGLIRQLQDLIWEVKTTDTTTERQPKSTVDRGIWRRLTDLDRAELARDYVGFSEDKSVPSANRALAESRGWKRTFAIDCVVRLRGNGFLTPSTEPVALTEKARLLLGEQDVYQTVTG